VPSSKLLSSECVNQTYHEVVMHDVSTLWVLAPRPVRSHSSFTRWFYRTHARSSVSPLLSPPSGRLYAPLLLDVLRAHRQTPYIHGDARRTSALAVHYDNGTSSALPAAVSSALSSPRLIGLAERTVSSMSLFPSTMSSVYPRLASLTFSPHYPLSMIVVLRPSCYLICYPCFFC
jgi:hypothetical protein